MGHRLADGTWKDSCLDKVKPGEPIFVLRAQDATAPDTVEWWAESAEIAHEAEGHQITAELREKLLEARKTAAAMRAWQAENGSKLPD